LPSVGAEPAWRFSTGSKRTSGVGCPKYFRTGRPIKAQQTCEEGLDAFARRFRSGPERELLLLLGLFDRPALLDALAALVAPTIPGLTDYLAGLFEIDWDKLIRKLRNARLVAKEARHLPKMVDVHPLILERRVAEEAEPAGVEERTLATLSVLQRKRREVPRHIRWASASVCSHLPWLQSGPA
jgi:hypothetical protein